MERSVQKESGGGRATPRLLAWLTAFAMIVGLAIIPATAAQAGGTKPQPQPDTLSGPKGGPWAAKPVLPKHRVKNPRNTEECGLNIAVVVDNSGSINSMGGPTAIADVKVAAKALMNDFVGSGAVVSLIHFSSTAAIDVDSQVIETAADAAKFTPFIDNFKSAGSTNWQDALIKVRNLSTTPDLVLFTTDGRPNTINGAAPGSTVVPSDYTRAPADFSQTALGAATAQANALKSGGSHMFVVAFGAAAAASNPALPYGDTANIAVSGPRILPPGGDVNNFDFLRIGRAEDLRNALLALTAGLCTSIDKEANVGEKVRRGQTITYSVKLKNIGGRAVTSDLVDQLPAGVTYVTNSASVRRGHGPATSLEPTITTPNPITRAQTLTWKGVTVRGGGHFTATYKVKVNRDVSGGTVLTNTATWNRLKDSTTQIIKGHKICKPEKGHYYKHLPVVK